MREHVTLEKPFRNSLYVSDWYQTYGGQSDNTDRERERERERERTREQEVCLRLRSANFRQWQTLDVDWIRISTTMFRRKQL